MSVQRIPSQKIPALTWVLSSLFVGGFLGFMYYLSTLPLNSRNPLTEPTAKTAPLSKKAQESDQAPVAMQQLDFYQLLKEQKVQVATKETPTRAPKKTLSSVRHPEYILQAGSFTRKKDAERLRGTLILEGFNATTEPVTVKGKAYHRVYVGPFQVDQQLQLAKSALYALKLEPLVIKKRS